MGTRSVAFTSFGPATHLTRNSRQLVSNHYKKSLISASEKDKFDRTSRRSARVSGRDSMARRRELGDDRVETGESRGSFSSHKIATQSGSMNPTEENMKLNIITGNSAEEREVLAKSIAKFNKDMYEIAEETDDASDLQRSHKWDKQPSEDRESANFNNSPDSPLPDLSPNDFGHLADDSMEKHGKL